MDNTLHYTLTLTAVGPVHIGSGEEISKKECLYLSNEKKVYILDSMKLFNGLKRSNLLGDYEKYLLDPRQKNFTFFVNEHHITPSEYKSWAAYTLPLGDIANTMTDSRSRGGGSDNIAAFMKDSYGMPYIPGSSLKGALRTAIQNALIEKSRENFRSTASQITAEEFRSRTKYLSRQNDGISQQLFYKAERNTARKGDAVNDIFQGLRVSDSRPLSVDDLILCQKIDFLPDGNSKNLPIKRECLKPGTKIVFELDIDRNCIKLSDEAIYRALDSSYRMYKESFLKAFGRLESTEMAGGHLICIGGGAGFATKTSVYPLYDDREKGTKAVQQILINTTSTRSRQDPHKHINDVRKYHVSPHMRKCTKYRKIMYDMGLCRVDIE